MFLDRPTRHIFVICNPYSGARHSRHTYNSKIKTLLERAQYKITYAGKFSESILLKITMMFCIEIDEDCTADEVLQNFEDDFDSIDRYEIYLIEINCDLGVWF